MVQRLKRRFTKTAASLISRAGLSQRVMASRDVIPRKIIDLARSCSPLPLPDDVQFEITMRCNLNCVMCHQKERRKRRNTETDLEGIKKIIDNFAGDHIKRVKLVGGEVFLRDDLIDIISYLAEKRIGVSITTNGTLLNDEIIRELSAHDNILGMVFSIDGMEDVHNRIRRARSGFSDAITNLEKVGANGFVTKITCVVQKDNLQDVKQMIHQCKSWKVHMASFMAETFFLQKDLSRTAQMLESMGEFEFFVSASDTETNDYSLDEFMSVLDTVRTTGQNESVFAYVSPQLAARRPEEFYNGRILRNKSSVTCGYINRLTITEAGDVLSCPFMDLKFGNLLQQDIADIWNSERFVEYRNLLVSNGLFPICRRCCVLARIK